MYSFASDILYRVHLFIGDPEFQIFWFDNAPTGQ